MQNYRTNLRMSHFALMATLGCSSMCLPSVAFSDIYVWGKLTGLASDPTTCAASAEAVDVRFTMINPTGGVLQNTDASGNTYSGYQTETCGTLTYNTGTQSGTGEIVAFNFFGAGPAEAQAMTVDLIPSPAGDLGIGNLFLGNMLFNWSGNNGIPVSIVWDAQGVLGEMDGAPASFMLTDNDTGANNDSSSHITITQTASSPFAGVGGTPATDGNDASWLSGFLAVELNQGPVPMASTRYNTTNVGTCQVPDPGLDGIFNTADDIKDCMLQNPSADIAASIVADTLTNPTATEVSGTWFDGNSGPYPTASIDGMGGNPMQDGPFTGFNANFDWNNLKLVGFTDTTPPVVTMNAHVSPAGTATVTLLAGTDTYSEPNATCADAAPLNTNLDADVVVGGDVVDDTTGGTYVVTYNCADPSGNLAVTATRTVVVIGAGPPAITLSGSNPATQECAVAYTDAGASCDDAEDGVIPVGANFSLNQSAVDAGIDTVSSYSAIWTCQDITNPNPAVTASRTVNVVDTTSPVVTLVGSNPHQVIGSTIANAQIYTDPGADVTDGCDTSLPANINATSGSVSMTVADTQTVVPYTLTYSVTDAEGNTGSVTRNVEVSRAQPVITMIGSASAVLDVGAAYVEQGFDVEDLQDGNLTAVTTTGVTAGAGAGGLNITHTITGTVDTSVEGTYVLTYDATDSHGNPATPVTRTIIVGVFASGSNFSMLDAGGNVFGGTNDVVFDWPEALAVLAGDYSSLNAIESDTKFNMTIASAGPEPFFGAPWYAHHVRVFTQGTYTFDTTCTVAQIEAGTTACNNPLVGAQTQRFMTMTVGAGQLGAHMLFDYNGSFNIDVVNVWNVDGVWDDPDGDASTRNDLWSGSAGLAPDPALPWALVSIDVDADGNNGAPMLDGPFIGFSANFNAGPTGTLAAALPITTETVDTKLGGGVINWLVLLSILPVMSLLRRRK